jgi:NADH:ubiquinone oxidoreductase subunit 4 (subunit M)
VGLEVDVVPRSITLIAGPMGCGKTTLLKSLNRFLELSDGTRITGQVLVDEQDIYADDVDVTEVRKRVGLLAQRAGGSEDLRDMGGIAFRAPLLATIFLVVALATLAMPGSANFVGEFLILLGVFKAKLAIAAIAFAGVVMASFYALRLFIRAMHNRVPSSAQSREMTLADGLVLVPLVLCILALALYPQVALHRSEPAVKATIGAQQATAAVADAGETR